MGSIETMILRVPAILIALTIHEFAHGYVAFLKGDSTAKHSGRLSFNPLSHLDPIGTLMLLFGPFGWAKPVPVNPLNLENPRKDMVWVAGAGPASNVVLAIIVGLVLRGLLLAQAPLSAHFYQFLYFLYVINLGLAFFNLLPFPPLDGYNITIGLLPQNRVAGFVINMRHAPKILIFLIVAQWIFDKPIFTTILNPIWNPWFNFWNKLILG
jgi:Zn-dependent protease